MKTRRRGRKQAFWSRATVSSSTLGGGAGGTHVITPAQSCPQQAGAGAGSDPHSGSHSPVDMGREGNLDLSICLR